LSIEVNKLSKRYGDQMAVNEVSFTIPSGEVVGFLGPNGAGKSTTMKMLTCFIPQTSGTAKVNGFDIGEDSMKVRKSVGYLPEHNPLYLDMYVKEYLGFVAKLQGVKNTKSKIKDIISDTGLELEQRKKIGALSKGYRQRVGLAQALIHDPEVLILDEPTSGLDPNQIEDIRTLIKRIGEKKTVMLSTHIMQEVEAICDRVIIINHGKIVADDSTVNLKASSSRTLSYLVEFKGEANKNKLKSLPWVKEISQISDAKWRIDSNSKVNMQEDIFRYAVDHNLIIISLQQVENSLEDVFHKLTKK
jgi:ABC-2 type transport system ATP-binding protein